MIKRITGALFGIAIACAAAQPAAAQPAAASPAAGAAARAPRPPRPPVVVPPGVVVQHIKVHGAALVGNLEGEPVDRDVIVILPPSYANAKARHYPVVYFMHGFALTAQGFYDFMHVPETIGASSAKGVDFIVVMPDTDTKLGGSMYSNSPTTGDFETFIAKDVVSYIDGHYRTIAKRSGRGLAGHSMGGYGVWKVAMRYPQVWSSIYAMSACCVGPRTETVEAAKKLAAIPYDQAGKASFGDKAALASAAAWSPNPKNPPYYMDFAIKGDAIDPLVIAKWANNSPLAMVPTHTQALKSFTAIASDGGDQDGLTKDATSLHEEMDGFGITNSFEIYPGTHTSGIVERFGTKVLPFFAAHLTMK
jgi:enterochelin esterase-like enzyme